MILELDSDEETAVAEALRRALRGTDKAEQVGDGQQAHFARTGLVLRRVLERFERPATRAATTSSRFVIMVNDETQAAVLTDNAQEIADFIALGYVEKDAARFTAKTEAVEWFRAWSQRCMGRLLAMMAVCVLFVACGSTVETSEPATGQGQQAVTASSTPVDVDLTPFFVDLCEHFPDNRACTHACEVTPTHPWCKS